MITQPQPFQTFILIRKILMSFKMLFAKQHRREKIRMRTYIENPARRQPSVSRGEVKR